MKQTLRHGRVAGLPVTAARSAVVGSLVLWALGSVVASGVFRAAPLAAVLAGVLVVLLHWTSDLLHQVGHASAARRTGYPATGIRLWGLLSTIRYPVDE